jgi:hypothetical protein
MQGALTGELVPLDSGAHLGVSQQARNAAKA